MAEPAVTDLHYLDPGHADGKPVLLLHGLGVDGSSWQLQFEPLISSGFRPIAPDAPGFGRSPRRGRGWSVRTAAEAIAHLVGDIRAAPAHVVGISMGGVIALQVALDHPQLVGRLVLVNTFARIRPDTPGGWLYYARRALLAHTVGLPTQAKFVARHLFPLPEQEPLRQQLVRHVSAADPSVYRAALRALGLYNAVPRLTEIRAPTLVITGDRDTTVAPRNQSALAAGIAGARQVILPGAGHAMTVECPQHFNRVMLDFLGED